MPAFPDIPDGVRLEGGTEIHRQFKAEHSADATRHITVTAEIKVKLETVAQNRNKSRPEIQIILHHAHHIKHGVHKQRKYVSQKYFFPKAQYKQRHAVIKHFPVRLPVFPCLQRRNKFTVQYDGARNQLGKECHKTGIVQQTVAGRFSLVTVHHIGNLLEREKADTQRQCNFFYLPVRMKKEIAVVHEKIKILKIKQQSDIGNKSQC